METRRLYLRKAAFIIIANPPQDTITIFTELTFFCNRFEVTNVKTAGIITEYNPLHYGHAALMEAVRRRYGPDTAIVCAMSGDFVQRGDFALVRRRARAEAALRSGADLVLELPLPWAVSSAEGFARGGVEVLASTGLTDVLAFGSECGDADALLRTAQALESPAFPALLKAELSKGGSFAAARQTAAARLLAPSDGALLSTPNNTLGIEYLKALRRLHSPIQPYTVPRFGAAHDSVHPVGDMASASYVRLLVQGDRLMSAAPYMPVSSSAILSEAVRSGQCPARIERLERALLCTLRRLSRADWAALPDIAEGLENRLYTAARQATGYEELVDAVKTRRYTRTRIQRLLWNAFLGITAEWQTKSPPYIRVLGMNDRGAEILTAARHARAAQAAPLPILSRAAQIEQMDDEAQRVFALECLASDLYALALPNPPPCGADFTDSVLRVE